MSHGSLDSLLARAARYVQAFAALRALCVALGLVLACAVGAVLLDGLLALPVWGLAAVDLFMLALVVAAFVWAAVAIWRERFHPQRMARRLEVRLNIDKSLLINAVDLSRESSPRISESLRRLSVGVAETRAASLPAGGVVDYRALRRPALLLAGALAAGVLLIALAPRLVTMVAPRYLDPLGDHPPYTLFDFAIQIEPETVYQGRPAAIRCQVTGPYGPPSAADVVFSEGEAGPSRLPMLADRDGKFTLPIDRAATSRDFYIDTKGGRSARQRFTVAAVPLFESAHVSYQFPEYTDFPPAAAPLDARGIRALAGTTVRLTVTSNLPLSAARLELFSGRLKQGEKNVAVAEESLEGSSDTKTPAETLTLSPRPDDPRTAELSFPLRFTGHYRLSLVGIDGAPGIEQLTGPITAIEDRLPVVQIIEPAPQVLAVENWKIPVTIRAVDDIQLASLELFCSVNGWGPTKTALDVNFEDPKKALGRFEFDLGALGVRVGDVITYYASARDTCPEGERFTDTATYIIQVISEEEYKEFARKQYRLDQLTRELDGFKRELEALRIEREKILEQLQQLKEKLSRGEPLTAEEQEQLMSLERQLEKFSQEAERVAEEMAQRAEQPELYDFEKPYQEELQKLAERLRRQKELSQQLSEKLSQARQSSTPPKLSDLEDEIKAFEEEDKPFDKQSQEELEQTADDMQMMEMADRMLAAADQLKQLIQEQRDLADRMGQFRDQQQLSPEEQQRANRMAKEQEQLKQQLEEAVQEMEQCAGQCEGGLPRTAGEARELVQKIRDLSIAEEQGQAARSSREGKGQEAHESADSAAEKLESLLQDMPDSEGMASEMSSRDNGLGMTKGGMKQALDQLGQSRRNMPGMGQQQGPSSGGSSQGSQSNMAVMGPHMAQGEPTDAQSGESDEQVAGMMGAGSSMGESGDAESLEPTTATGRRSAAGALRGVPVGYREQAEAYFERLAEEK